MSSVMMIVRPLGIWAALVFGMIAGAMVLGLGNEGVGTDGPIPPALAPFLVNGLHAIALTFVAMHARVSRVQLFILIAVIYYAVNAFLQHMEALWFLPFLDISAEFVFRSSGVSLIQGLLAGGVAALMWPDRREVEEGKLPVYRWRFGVAIFLYIFAFVMAGFFIAWANEDVQAYYDFGDEIAVGPLFLFQILRGAMWTGLVVLLGRVLQGPLILRGGITGLAFAVLAASQLLYPSDFMPWEVRWPHLIEVGLSNFLYGFLAMMVLFAGVKRSAM